MMLSRCVFYIMGRAIVIAVILQSDPSTRCIWDLERGSNSTQNIHTFNETPGKIRACNRCY
jgi:hypothetical protein